MIILLDMCNSRRRAFAGGPVRPHGTPKPRRGAPMVGRKKVKRTRRRGDAARIGQSETNRARRDAPLRASARAA